LTLTGPSPSCRRSRGRRSRSRALQDYEPGRGVILLDEATRALTRPSLAHFYELLRAVIAEGASVVLVSHRLEEVLEACDRIAVLRDGEFVAPAVPAGELGEARLTRLMLGYEQRSHARENGKARDDHVAEVASLRGGLTLPRVGQKGRRWLIGHSWQLDEAQEMILRLGITPPRPDALVSTLSGGNQQTVLLGKWLAGEPRLLLLHEPTQGVDVGARGDIINVLRAEAERGCSVLMSATDVGDLALMCDRVLILRDGRVVGELTGEFDQDDVVEATFRPARSAPPAA
jgi:ABC-type sugar transport system ATPase subunit